MSGSTLNRQVTSFQSFRIFFLHSLRWQTTQRQKTGTVVFASLGCVKLPQLMLRRQQGSTSPLVLLTPPLFFLVVGRVGPPKGPHHENIRFFLFFFPERGGGQSRETQAARIKCTTKESDEPQLKLIAALMGTA